MKFVFSSLKINKEILLQFHLHHIILHFGKPLLQCNELNRGHPTFFCQSQDELRKKESEFVHFGPITNERLAVKSYLFPSTKRRLNIHCWAPRIFKTKTDQTYIHFPMMAWLKEKEIQRKFDLYFQICFPNDLTVARRSRMLTDMHRNVK